MKPIQAIYHLLSKPFPEQESSFGEPKITAFVSLFVAFFLYIFEPFGIDSLESGKLLVCLGFGAMTFLGAVIFEFITGPLLNLKGQLAQWTFGKWILNNLGILLTISLTNFLFARLVLFGYIQWDLFPHMLYGTFMVGIIPIVALGVFAVLRQEKKYQDIAEGIKPVKPGLHHEGEGGFIFDLPVSRILYIQGLQNYVTIGYLDEDGRFCKKTERAALKGILESVSGNSIIRSHRSFLVNRNAIVGASGNAQGLLLQLTASDRTIPVSRSYVSVFRELLS